ncbi:MAG: flagellar export chaperone FlgN [Planctomycetota bacterium]
MQELSTQQLAGLIDQRLRLLAQFLAIGQKQAELIAADETGSLLRLLGAKNQLIAALKTIEQRLAPFHEQDPEGRVWESPAAREACAAKAAECRLLLEKVMQQEKANEIAITARRDAVAEKLESTTAATLARNAYRENGRAAGPAGPHYVSGVVTGANVAGQNAAERVTALDLSVGDTPRSAPPAGA